MTAMIAECAENARQCKWYASKTKNAEERKFLLRMAKRWSELARVAGSFERRTRR